MSATPPVLRGGVRAGAAAEARPPADTPRETIVWWSSRAALLVATALAGWPVGRWFVARLDDGSDEPWGLVALVLAVVFLPWRRLCEPVPRRWLVAAGLVLAPVVVAYEVLPPLVRAGGWMLTLACLLGGTGPWIARSGLLALALPVVATAQFYLGYPLRALTAACSVPVLRVLGYAVQREGTALHWAGETVLIDAPCSGIQMLWSGLTTGCVLALVWRLDDRATTRLLRRAASIVALANVVRCVALFLWEIHGRSVAPWLHEGVGLALFGGALSLIAWLAARAGRRAPAQAVRVPARPEWATGPVNHRGCSARPGGLWAFAVLVVLGALRPFCVNPAGPSPVVVADFPGWPSNFEGRALTELTPGPREARFAAGFPGRMAAFSDGERTVLLRWIPAETRKLHPALHCLRGLGYTVVPQPVWVDAGHRRWGTLGAEKAGRRLRVRERIADTRGHEWTDVSAWWWAAWLGHSTGPWWVTTVLENR